MDVYKLIITRSAKAELREIAYYITSQLNAPAAAQNTVRAIRAAVAKLKTDALFHPLVRDERLAAMGYRPLIVKNYMAFYRVNEKEKAVYVDRILSGRRNWQGIL